MIDSELTREGKHMMKICNACRYCEGYCAVWRAMEFRREFSSEDLSYLSNLCHDCGDCYYACQYAPPHEFDINPPKVFARLRSRSWENYVIAPRVEKLVRRYGLLIPAILSLAGFLLFVVISVIAGNGFSDPKGSADFYSVVPHDVMVVIFSLAGCYVVAFLLLGFIRFWRDCGEKLTALPNVSAITVAAREALRLEYLDGDGWGCTYPDEKPSQQRRTYHHFAFFGFLFTFAATTVAAFYEYFLNWQPPYAFYSLPVIFGTVGGIGILIGTFGLLALKLRRNREISDNENATMDVSFIFMLMLSSLTGILLLFFRHTSSMPLLLLIHLGIVLAFFLLLPFSKFVHSVYRLAALLKYALERERKKIIGL